MSNRLAQLTQRLGRAGAPFRTTPGRLWAAGAAVALVASFFCVIVLLAVRSQRQGVQTLGKDSAPSIVEAQHIKANLADMHAQAANMLLADPHNNGAAATIYYRRREAAMNGIVTAAGLVTYGERERVPLRQLLQGLAQYESFVSKAVLMHENGNPLYLTQFRVADEIMHSTVLPAASMLDAVNHNELSREYREQETSSWRWRVGVGLTGALQVAVLVGVQWFLYRRMRRVFNPALLAATIAALVFLVYTVAALNSEAKALKVAKQDAFESIHLLWRARADAYDANAEESLWLLECADARRTGERRFAEKHDKAFAEAAGHLARVGTNLMTPESARALGRSTPPKEYTGLLMEELRNITFDGEQDRALDTLARYADYLAIDKEIRRLESKGAHDKAVALCLGEAPGESNYAFDQFDKALEKVLAVNQTEFDRHIERGFAKLSGFEMSAPIAALSVVALAFLGLRPRLREYAP
jgi:hypothetical protein